MQCSIFSELCFFKYHQISLLTFCELYDIDAQIFFSKFLKSATDYIFGRRVTRSCGRPCHHPHRYTRIALWVRIGFSLLGSFGDTFHVREDFIKEFLVWYT